MDIYKFKPLHLLYYFLKKKSQIYHKKTKTTDHLFTALSETLTKSTYLAENIWGEKKQVTSRRYKAQYSKKQKRLNHLVQTENKEKYIHNKLDPRNTHL